MSLLSRAFLRGIASLGTRPPTRYAVSARPQLLATWHRNLSSEGDIPQDIQSSSTSEDFDSGSQLSRTRGLNNPTKALYLTNFPYGTTENELRSHFSDCVEVRIPSSKRTDQEKQFGYGFVEYSSVEDAAAALEKAEGLEIGGRTIQMNYATPSDQRPKVGREGNLSGLSSPTEVLFLRNLPYGTTESELKSLFPGCVDIRIPLDMGTGRQMGFAYVEFQSVEEAEDSFEKLSNKLELQNRQIYLDFARKLSHRQNQNFSSLGRRSNPSSILFLKNFPYDTTEEELKEMFPDCVAVRIPTRSFSGKSFGYAYVEFTSVKEAEAALNTSDSLRIGGRPIYFDFAHERERKGINNINRRFPKESFEDNERTMESFEDDIGGKLSEGVDAFSVDDKLEDSDKVLEDSDKVLEDRDKVLEDK